MDFELLFLSEEKPYKGNSSRDKYLSRVFGIFNEDIIRVWCNNPKSPYSDLGRPTIYDSDGKCYTLDFSFKDSNENIFVGEMKCEIEYEKYKYLVLDNAKKIEHHIKSKRAFQLFLDSAKDPDKFKCKISNEIITIHGAILVWGKTSNEGVNEVITEYGIEEVISTEKVISDLISWQDDDYQNLISKYKTWSNELFNGLIGDKCQNI